MTVIELKQYIFENEKIEHVLESIGCHHIKYHANKEYYSCANHDGDNEAAINIKNNPYLNVINWTRPSDFDEMADLITLTQYNKKISFVEAIKYLHSVLGLEYKIETRRKKNKSCLSIKSILKNYSVQKRIDVSEIDVYDESVLEDYVPLLYVDWVKKEGILERTRKKFNIMYSYEYSRIVIPHRYWLTGELVGYNMRTTVEHWEDFGIKKYFLSPGYNKAINLYGLWENREEIENAGYVVVVEAEKSVLRRDARFDHTLVALSGKSMSDEQCRILKGLDVKEIVIALDKDVPLREVRYMCEKLWRSKKVSYIYDKYDLLGEKDSPADASMKIYDYLFEFRIPYDESEHQKLMETFKNK